MDFWIVKQSPTIHTVNSAAPSSRTLRDRNDAVTPVGTVFVAKSFSSMRSRPPGQRLS